MVAAALTATAPAQFYAQRSNEIRAAVALIQSDQVGGYARNHAPFVWYNLENNRKIRPAGMTFSNPAHLTVFTDATVARWNALVGGSPAAGTIVKKQHAPYWELDLNTATSAQMAQLDVILLASYGTLQLNSIERDKLRAFVEKGGLLWIDTASSTTMDAVNNLPLPFTTTNAVLGMTPGVDTTQALVSRPNVISGSDLVFMQGDTVASMNYLDLGALGLGGLRPLLFPLESDSARIAQVAVDNRGTFLATGQLGEGHIVITTRAVARMMNRVFDYATNSYNLNIAPVARPFNYDRGADSASKLVLNMINMVGGHSQSRGGSRRAGSSAVDVGAPQLERFVHESPNAAVTNNAYRPPAMARGAIAMSVGDHVVVYDANPRSDLDGDGNPDDGLVDYADGLGYDLIWESTSLPGPISAPIIIEVPDAVDQTMLTQVVVTDATGTVHGFPLFTYNANGSFVGSAAIAPTYSITPSSGAASFSGGVADPGPYPPAFHEGYLYMNDVQDTGLGKSGRVWVANPATGRQVTTGVTGWSLGGSSVRIMGEPGTPPTVGYIPVADNSGAYDKVMYVATRPNPIGLDANSNAAIQSLWIGVKGETPAAFTSNPGFLEVSTRASTQGLSILNPTGANDEAGLGVRLTILKPDGTPYTAAEMNAVFSGTVTETNGILRFNYNAGQEINAGDTPRVDYTIDWGTGIPSMGQQVLRGNIIMPDDGTRARRILHNIALSPEGIIHVVHSSQNPSTKAGGAYFAIKEEGRGSFKVLNRFDLYPSHQIPLNQAAQSTVTYPATLGTTDPLGGLIGAGAALSNITYVGGPTIRDGVCYVTAKAFTGFIPYTVVMAFKAKPDPLTIRVGNVSEGFQLLQPDLTRSQLGGSGRPDNYNILQAGQYEYGSQSGSNDGIIRFDNLSTNTRGIITNALSTSQPVILRQNGSVDTLIEPNSLGSSWNQMLWYTAIPGIDSTSPAYVSGSTLFVAGQSFWPNIVPGVGFVQTGQLVAMDTQISETNAYVQAGDPNRPWFKQVHLLRTNPTFSANPTFLWPSTKGITSFGDYTIRLEQSVMRTAAGLTSNPPAGVVAGDGVVASWTSEGLWTFSKGDFLVADEGRIIRLDSSGSPIWSMNQTYRSALSGDSGGAQQTNPIVRATRVYSVNEQEVLFVDTGANRVVRADISGRETRSIDSFTLDAVYRPAGYTTNETTKLNAPRDAITYNSVHTSANNPFSNPAPYEYWRHYFIADSGNRRLVEIVDRFQYDPATRRVGDVVVDSNGNQGIGVLLWHSPAEASGGRFAYTSVSRIYSNGNWVFAAGVGNKLGVNTDVGLDTPTGNNTVSSQDGNGAIVLFDGANTVVINEVIVPAIGANVYWNSGTGTYNSAAKNTRRKKLGGLRSVTMRNYPVASGAALSVMFTDNEGVFEVLQNASGEWEVSWMLDNSTYTTIRRTNANVPIPEENPLALNATYARRLENGDVVVCNGYTGFYGRTLPTDPRVSFTGEVIVLDGSYDSGTTAPLGFNWNKMNFGFRTLSIQVLLNNKPGASLETRGIVSPMFADKQ